VTRRRIRYTASARREIDEIAEFIARQSGSAETAMKWLSALDGNIDLLARVPGTGTARDDQQPGLRSSPIFSYLIFYRATPRILTVVRVVHGARDLSQIFRSR
jgi:toxin ParE1/3/4